MADFKRAEREADRLLAKFSIKEPPVDPEAIAEALGVSVVYSDFATPISAELSGYIDHDSAVIVVNRVIPPARKTYTIAHELGHHVLHKEYAKSGDYRVSLRVNQYDGEKPDEEKEADAFAANLLVPLRFLRRYKDFAPPSQLAKLFCVSQDVILNRMKWA